MKQHHLTVLNTEKNARDRLREIGSDFKQPSPEWPACWHADGPSELDGHDIHTDRPAFCARLLQQPLPDRLSAGHVSVESSGESLLDRHRTVRGYQYWYTGPAVSTRGEGDFGREAASGLEAAKTAQCIGESGTSASKSRWTPPSLHMVWFKDLPEEGRER